MHGGLHFAPHGLRPDAAAPHLSEVEEEQLKRSSRNAWQSFILRTVFLQPSLVHLDTHNLLIDGILSHPYGL